MVEREGTTPPGVLASRRRFLLALIGVGAGSGLLVACTGGQLRDLGGPGGGGGLVSDQEVDQMALTTWNRIRSSTPVTGDRALQDNVTRVGLRIAAASGTRIPRWQIVVFESPEVNAFALPGGRVGVYTGILAVMETEAQVAAVLGHEISHVNARHGVQRVNAEAAGSMAVQLSQWALAAGNVANAGLIAGLLGTGIQYGVILPYSRQQEREADQLGLFTMARAGYHPGEAIRFWQLMAARSGPNQSPEFLSTHPAEYNRIASLDALMPQAMPLYQRARFG